VHIILRYNEYFTKSSHPNTSTSPDPGHGKASFEVITSSTFIYKRTHVFSVCKYLRSMPYSVYWYPTQSVLRISDYPVPISQICPGTKACRKWTHYSGYYLRVFLL